MRTFRFQTVTIPDEKKYFESKRNVFITLIFTVLLFAILFIFTEYKESLLKIGIFAVFFGLYRLYNVITEPQLMMDSKGIHFRSVRVYWKDIKRIRMDFNKQVIFQIDFKNGKKLTEKIDHPTIISYQLPKIIRSFKKKYRTPFVLKK